MSDSSKIDQLSDALNDCQQATQKLLNSHLNRIATMFSPVKVKGFQCAAACPANDYSESVNCQRSCLRDVDRIQVVIDNELADVVGNLGECARSCIDADYEGEQLMKCVRSCYTTADLQIPKAAETIIDAINKK
eukprot:comp9191_c0_seq1/m.10520 comp9191_c0_seq1/g.10520  ORF comp9191_c0_seq1/g.10520 comp9191_c0_seq1/m.10520 type:complete len:134 (-) comp9191_c0_seq1:93-494(-)